MKFYNTLNRQIEEFKSLKNGQVKMYTCGPTVYHYAHIGNLRTYIMEDILQKALEYIGYNVNRVMNITDVGHLASDADEGEDKMVKGAKRENKSVLEIADYYTEKFKGDCDKLNIKWPSTVVKATSMIDDYIEFISKLIEKDYAYITGGNVYFDTSKLDNYYQLTNHSEDTLLEAVRKDVDIDQNKRNKTDFVLWFTKSKFDDQELKWESPWGLGYPGWHIECSCISLKYLGEYLDIHCGGVDNIFPHHTNEIAQTESYIGHKWCNYWFHPEHLNTDNGKMSKSKGEFLTLSLLESKGYSPMVYRLFCLQSHYQKQLIFSYDNMDAAQKTYDKLKNRIKSINKDNSTLQNDLIKDYQDKFKDCLENNLNTANALTILYEVLKSDLNNNSKRYLINDFDQVLSLELLNDSIIDEELKAYILEKINTRNKAKQNKDYDLADKIRDELYNKGIVIKDTREGTTFDIIDN